MELLIIIPLLIGVIVGFGEFILLKLFIRQINKANPEKLILIMALKLILVFSSLTLGLLLFKDYIWIIAAGIAGVLIILSVINYVLTISRTERKDQK